VLKLVQLCNGCCQIILRTTITFQQAGLKPQLLDRRPFLHQLPKTIPTIFIFLQL
jgi:hypothetical protein